MFRTISSIGRYDPAKWFFKTKVNSNGASRMVILHSFKRKTRQLLFHPIILINILEI